MRKIFFLLFVLLPIGLLAQSLAIKGSVTDISGNPIPGVSVILDKTSGIGTITDVDGNYSLNGVPNDAVLTFSFIGMENVTVNVAGKTVVDITMKDSSIGLNEVVAIGYGTQKKGAITGSISSVGTRDLAGIPSATISSSLAGKLAGVSFRMPDGRPGAGASIQIRNMGDPLFVIDGIQKGNGDFNNLSPNDIESISILKDASAAIYGSRGANGVVLVTTKTGKKNTENTIQINVSHGWQNWSRFPETVGAGDWMAGKADADMNQFNSTDISPEELAKWQEGTEPGYRSFNWYDYIIQPNAPQTAINVSTSGGSDKITYYLSYSQLDQSSVLGREFTFARRNIQSTIEAQVSNRIKISANLSGRIEKKENPGVPGGDDYWAPRFALFRNTPMDRPFANDNPQYLNNIGHNETNWALLNIEDSGYWREEWQVFDMAISGEYDTPIKGLKVKGLYSYHLADKLMNGHEYTYKAYSHNAEDDSYYVSFDNKNPWRERGTRRELEKVVQAHVNYSETFGKHSIAATFVAERIDKQILDVWTHAVPKTNVLPLIQFPDMDRYDDRDEEQARLGYVGRLNYSYDDKYYIELSGRRDASWKFAPSKRYGNFVSVSAGWRLTEEEFIKSLIGDSSFDFKLRGSYGQLGDDNVGIGDFDYISGYNYGSSKVVLDGETITGARDKGIPVDNISWFTSNIANIGADFSLAGGRLNGTMDYFYRKRSGLKGRKYDVLVPAELGYSLPDENVNSDANMGAELFLSYDGEIKDLTYSISGNISYARNKFLDSYKPRYGSSLDRYYRSGENRWTSSYWGYHVIGQFQSIEEINNYEVNIDGEGNKTLLPGDLIYEDVNQDGTINGDDSRPIGYARDKNPVVNFGINISLKYKGFDMRADFSGGSMYSYNRNWEMRNPFQNEGALLKEFSDDRWHRSDLYDVNSEWVSGKYPALRYNAGWHSNNRNSDFWSTNVKYLRMRTLEVGYTIPENLIAKIGLKSTRLYVNTYNLFSIDNVSKFGTEPEIMDENGLQYPQNKMVNVGVNITL